MKISYNWLKDYVAHTLGPQELADKLTMAGLEEEEVIPIGNALDGVLVGHVLETAQHPNADRLTLCQVDLGDGEPVQIVCGAPNVAGGQKVPVATVGTTLMLPSRDNPAEKVAVKLKKAKLRGEVSNGMICAEDELGLSDDHAGIMVLHDDATVGQPFEDYLAALGIAAQDAAIDIAITPNRPDATSHIGVARDVAALENLPLQRPEVTVPEHGGAAAEQIAIEIEDPDGCPRYVGIIVRGVEIKESPAWLKQRLTAIGLRPRNNVVDVTNYVMYECGQPLHAFDFDQIAGAKIIVRASEGGEPFTTLDSKEHTLPEGTLLICDAERPVALAGVMGGENSEVTDATTNILIESAYFDPSTVRRAAKLLGISTDASYRFERGVDRVGQAWAAARAAALITELGGGEIVPGMVDAHPQTPESPTLELRSQRVAQVLGVVVADDEIDQILTALGFSAEHVADGSFRVGVPTWRPDVEREIDLVEEVARIYGYDRIPEPAHTALPNRTPQALPADQLRTQARALLSGLGYRETYTNSLLSKERAETFNQPALATVAGDVVETLNPITQEMTTLRPSLLPGVLSVMAHNQNHGQEVLRFYEFGHVFHRSTTHPGAVPGYAEQEAVLIALSGPTTTIGWDQTPRTSDIYDLKGVTEALLASLRLPPIAMQPVNEATSVSSYHLSLSAGEQPIGVIARLSDELMDAHDLRTPVFFAELNWSLLVDLSTALDAHTYAAVPRFPTVNRDVAVAVARQQAVGPLLDAIRTVGQPLLRDVNVFDLYEGDRIEADQKSVAFALTLGADRTLKDAEVDRQVNAIVKRLVDDFGAVLRQ